MSADTTSGNPVTKRIVRYDQYYDARTFKTALRKTSKPKQKAHNSKHALVVRRKIDDRGRYRETVIDITSPALCEVLLKINEGVEGLELALHQPRTTPEGLFHSYRGLVQRLKVEETKTPCDENLILDIRAAIQLIDEDQGSELKELESLRLTSQWTQPEITYNFLWGIFTPNSLVFNHHEWTEQNQLLIVRFVVYSEDKNGRYFSISCDILHDDGNTFGYAKVKLRINEFLGGRPIVSLGVFPLEHHPHKNDIYAHAVKLGKQYIAMEQHAYREVSGQALRPEDRDPNSKCEKFYTSGRVMISPSAFRRFQPNQPYLNPTVHRPLSKETELTEEQYAVCTPVLLGFSFDRKSWGGFAISRLQDIIWNDDAFQGLVLGEKQKTLIHSLVRQHASQVGSGFDDIIKNKGRGLIGLLVGTPGCGKTLTAEAVAETTHRPLYAVSVGELGTTPDVVESRLLPILELAEMWKAVVLLDEAEIFLGKRNMTDITRNALVNIFLRQLEYYQGIMILTTNMVQQCDYAFESRIHFMVHYPELDHATRREIWAMFSKRLSLDFTNAELDNLAEHKLNGRQIKNAISSAQTIGLANGSPRLTIKDIGVVLDVLSDWNVAMGKRDGVAHQEKDV